MHACSLRRRTLLSTAAATLAAPALAQPRRGSEGAIIVAQVHDTSPGALDVSRDFLTGARAAWQDLNARGGLRGRPVQHLALEVDGSPASLQQAWRPLRALPSCVALSGTVGDLAAAGLHTLLQQDNDAAVAHVAPWLQNASLDIGDRTFPIFSGRQEQIAHALQSLSVSGVQELGVVFASAREAQALREDIDRAAATRKLRLTAWTATDLAQLGERLGPATPALLLFVGGTPELAQFTRGLERQARQRYVLALADVNLQTLQQLGGARSTPVIVTQAVPLASAALPIVRRYREVLGRLFDEPPSALSLAGFIAAQYTHEVLASVAGPITRASALAAFQRRQDVDLGGYRVSFAGGQRRSAGFVTQSMLTVDGRVIG